MPHLKTEYPIYSLDNELLLPAGTTLSKEVMEDLCAGRPDEHLESVLDYGEVRKDMWSFLSTMPYSEIFADQERTAEIFSQLEEVRLSIRLLQGLDYFKKNDFHTYRHVLMVFILTATMAKTLQPDHAKRIEESMTGPTHDFGKICVPLKVLKKSTPLTKEEYKILRHHTIAGYVLLAHELKDPHHLAADVALNHHERLDGSGYPQGAKELSNMAEIVAAVDVYDALISPRPYRPQGYDNRTALEVLTTMAEHGAIGWDSVKALIAHNRQDKPDYRDVVVSSEKRGTPPSDNMYGVIVDEEDSSEPSP